MYLENFLEKYNDKKVKMFVDMDGVIADFNFGEAHNFDKKRPLYSSISKLENISKKDNVDLYIFSATRMNKGYDEKQYWLDKYAPFFKKENRVIISREKHDFLESSELKADYMKNIERDGSVLIVIDDDPKNLRAIRKLNDDVVLLKDTALID